MSASSSTRQQYSSLYPSYQLSAVLLRHIQAVAEYVAKNGTALESRFRSVPDARRQYFFMFPGNIHEPYYQEVLEQAFARRDATAYVPVDELPPPAPSKPSKAISGNADDSDTTLMQQGDVAQLVRFTYGEHETIPIATSSDSGHILTNNNDGDQRVNTQSHSTRTQTRGPSRQELRKRTRLNTIRGDNLLHSGSRQTPDDVTPYGLQQEVHLLDSKGTERGGLSTYIITSHSKQSARAETASSSSSCDKLNGAKLTNDSVNSNPQQEPIYRLRPDTSVTFRASHRRVLPVGFPLGAEVQQINNVASSIVVRRTVEQWKRFYDVKDEFGDTYIQVPEANLQYCSGGLFDFRTPNVWK